MTKSYSFTNQEISQLLKKVGAAYSILGGNVFKIMAYDRAASSIEHLNLDIEDFWKEGKLGDVPGIGTSIASHLNELFKTGKVGYFNHLFYKLPPAMFEFLKLPGIGPKTALKLAQTLRISKKEGAIDNLKKAAQSGKIKVIPGFGPQSEEKILASLAEYGRRDKRLLLPRAYNVSWEIISYLQKCKDIINIDTLGSLRRKCATIGDIDIAASSDNPKKVVDCFISYPKAVKVVESGENKARILLPDNIQVDLLVLPNSSYGSLLQHFTGSKQHNIDLRQLAQSKNLSLSEYGIKAKGKLKKYSQEKDFYKGLGMQWIPPEIREATGEIELARKNNLPRLIEEKDLKGDLHIHSSFDIQPSHDLGRSGLADIYKKAQSMSYEYIGLSEHNPSISKHNDIQIIDLIKKKKEYIEQFIYSQNKFENNRVKKVIIFNSLEIDILPNGKRAVSDKVLEILDFGVVSIHSSFRLGKVAMTQRILRGLDHPKVKILGHPTGRKLSFREGCEVDWDKIFDFCLKNHKFLEINSWPDRLDLPDTLIREAVKAGVSMVVNSDSHEASQLENIKFGVWTARRGWAGKSDIINTLSYNKFKQLLRR